MTRKAGALVAVAVLAALTPTTPARADSADDLYAFAQAQGISGTRDQLAKAGRDVCAVMQRGTTLLTALAATVELDDPQIESPDQAAMAGTAQRCRKDLRWPITPIRRRPLGREHGSCALRC